MSDESNTWGCLPAVRFEGDREFGGECECTCILIGIGQRCLR